MKTIVYGSRWLFFWRRWKDGWHQPKFVWKHCLDDKDAGTTFGSITVLACGPIFIQYSHVDEVQPFPEFAE